jgi:hypothetical protein
MYRLAAAAILIMLGCSVLAPIGAHASQAGVMVLRKWRTMDKCSKEAQTAFPDYTPDANTKRDAKLKECLEIQNLPPREPLSPAQ